MFHLRQDLDESGDLASLLPDLIHAEPILGNLLHCARPEELPDTKIEVVADKKPYKEEKVGYL